MSRYMDADLTHLHTSESDESTDDISPVMAYLEKTENLSYYKNKAQGESSTKRSRKQRLEPTDVDVVFEVEKLTDDSTDKSKVKYKRKQKKKVTLVKDKAKVDYDDDDDKYQLPTTNISISISKTPKIKVYTNMRKRQLSHMSTYDENDMSKDLLTLIKEDEKSDKEIDLSLLPDEEKSNFEGFESNTETATKLDSPSTTKSKKDTLGHYFKNIACDVCKKDFKTRTSLNVHKKVHDVDRRKSARFVVKANTQAFKCTNCNEVFKNSIVLRKHKALCKDVKDLDKRILRNTNKDNITNKNKASTSTMTLRKAASPLKKMQSLRKPKLVLSKRSPVKKLVPIEVKKESGTPMKAFTSRKPYKAPEAHSGVPLSNKMKNAFSKLKLNAE